MPEAREVLVAPYAAMTTQCGNAVLLPNGNVAAMFTMNYTVREVRPGSGTEVWRYDVHAAAPWHLYRMERLSTIPHVVLAEQVRGPACPEQLVFHVWDVYRARVAVHRSGRVTLYKGTSAVAVMAFVFQPYWLPTSVRVQLPAQWCAAPPALASVEVVSVDGVGVHWPLQPRQSGDLQLVYQPLSQYVSDHC